MAVRRLVRHRPSALGAYTVAGGAVVIATFLPWLHSGSTSRSSYELLGLVERLDIAPDGVVSTLIRWWPLVPLLVTIAVVLGWWQRWVASSAVALAAVAYSGGVGSSLAWQARGTPITLGAGPWVCHRERGVPRDRGLDGVQSRQCSRRRSTSRSTAGRSVMSPSTPRSSSRSISAGSSIVHTCTWMPRACARSTKRSSVTVSRP